MKAELSANLPEQAMTVTTDKIPVFYGDIQTIIPDITPINAAIIDRYLVCLASNVNCQTGEQHSQVITIYTSGMFTPGSFRNLLGYGIILLPVKRPAPEWALCVLRPPRPGSTIGSIQYYDSYWSEGKAPPKGLIHDLAYQRIGTEYDPQAWQVTNAQGSKQERSTADGSLFVLANAKSVVLGLDFIDIRTDEESLALRWQIVEELKSGVIRRGF